MLKKLTLSMLFVVCAVCPSQKAQAANPWAAVIKAAVKKVVKAVDLMIQRRQNRVIRLQNAQKALENTMAKLKLDEITSWVRKQRELYRQYYDELKKVKQVIALYFRVKAIADKQSQIIALYQKAWGLFSNDKHFSADELAYMQKVYAGILQQTAKSVELLTLVVKSFDLQMTDVKRLEIIDQAAAQAEKVYDELTMFNHENQLLSLSRAKDQADALTVKALYGIP